MGIMKFKSFSWKWWWYGIVEDLYQACENELRSLEDTEYRKGHDWLTSEENLLCGWLSVARGSLFAGGDLTIMGPYHCTWESPQHQAIRSRYAGKVFQRRIAGIPQVIGVIGGLLGIASFIMQCVRR